MNQSTHEMRGRRPSEAGFTMVEVLTVIAVMAILMSVAAVGIQRIDKGQATTSALAIAEAIFDEARSAAVGRGTQARVLLHYNLNDNDEDDRERYLRYMAVAIYDEDNKEWELISRGTMLPAGVYYDPDLSDQAARSIPDIGSYGTTTMKLPGKVKTPKKCYYYEFNGEGICVDGDAASAKPGGAFVLVGGVRPRGETKPRMQGNNQTGFVVWRNGRTSIYRSPEQIDN